LRQGSLLYFVGCQTTQVCQGTRSVMQAPKKLLCSGILTSCWALGSDACTFLVHAVMSSWQDKWAQIVGNKLCMMKPFMHVWNSFYSSIRTEEVIIVQLWIGHYWHHLCAFVKRWPSTIFITSAMSPLLFYASYRHTHIMMQKTNIQSSWHVVKPCRWSL
jgi:hypothetical protein